MNTLFHYDPDDPYPESDGLPMAENTEQYEWLVKIKENLEILFAEREDVCVAGNLFWYPVPDRRIAGPVAPDVMVVFGRPKGKRGTYRQWEEADIPPQVVFEILSPANSRVEMTDKQRFYDAYGVEEYYVYDPDGNVLDIWQRRGPRLERMTHLNGWISPRLGVRFALTNQTLLLEYPDGRPFLNSVQLARQADTARAQAAAEQHRAEIERQRAESEWQRAETERQRAETERQRAESEWQRAETERQRADMERARAERLAARLRALGIDPNAAL